MYIWKKILFISIVFVTVIGLIVMLRFASQTHDDVCENVYVEVSDYGVLQFVSISDIEKHLKQQNLYPQGNVQSTINLAEIETCLLQLNVVKDVNCYFTPTGDVSISVTQRVPIFRVKNECEDYYVDKDRNKMSTSIKFSAYVPIVTGSVSFDYVSTELFDFMQYLQSESRWRSAFTQICVYEEEKIELIPRVGNFAIRLGALDRYEFKLEKLDKFLSVLPKYYSWNEYSIINLEYKDQVVCTERKK